MSFEEKGTWLYLVIISVLPVAYFATILGQLSSVPVAEIDYQAPVARGHRRGDRPGDRRDDRHRDLVARRR